MAITMGVGFAALNTGNNLLYLVVSLMLGFLVLSGLLSEAALRGIRIERRLPRELFAGTANPISLEVHNCQRRVHAFAVVVEDLWSNAGDPEPTRAMLAGRVFALRVGPGSRVRRRYECFPERRGALRWVGYRVSTRFPFGLFVKSLGVDDPAEAVVYPRVEAISPALRRGAAHQTAESSQTRRGGSDAVSGLREFQRGDALRHIHWKSTARRNALIVSETEEEHDAQIEVLLRTAGPPGEDFERRVSWAASEVVCHLDAGLSVALRTDARLFPADRGVAQRARLLGYLAHVVAGAEAIGASGGTRRRRTPQRGAPGR